ncbi:MAG: hypothetical protein AB8G11_07500 [Saprospiraceae bacterium]
MKLKFTILVISGFLFTFCRPTRHIEQNSAANLKKTIFLDKEAAQKAITTDQAEGFFEKIQLLDIQVQMKNNTINHEDAKNAYRAYLRASVEEFTDEEEIKIRFALRRIQQMCDEISMDIFPQELKLVKTNMNHYGASVFYSRENTIIIPKNVLRRDLNTDFIKSMLREIFHIYTRYNYWKRMELYKKIGFEPIQNLDIPISLKNKILTNPDGVEPCVIHNLSDRNNDNFSAVPIITVKHKNLQRSLSFYSNIEFSLYKIEGNKIYMNEDGTSTIDIENIENFYEQIGTNTNYIIHPNEILADNFAMLVLWKSDYTTISELGIEVHGKSLLLAIEEVLKMKTI